MRLDWRYVIVVVIMFAVSTHFQFSNEHRTVAILVCAAITAACAAGKSSPENEGSTTSAPAIVATVNGRSIPTKLYEMYLKNGREELGLDPGTSEGRNKLDQLREGIVSELIDRTLIADEAERRGLSITPERLSDAGRRAIADLGGEQQYDTYLAAHRMSRDEYREVIRMQVYGQALREDLSKALTVSDEEIRTYYESHRSEQIFQKQERVAAAHILIAARPALIAQQLQEAKALSGDALASAVRKEIARRRRRAEQLRRKAAAGTDFGALAKESSEDQGTRAQGGELGTFTRDSHPRAFDDAAFSLKAGRISSVVQTEYGFHVIKVTAHEPAGSQTLAEATPEIRRLLLGRREAEKLSQWLKETRRKASVHINEPFRFGSLASEFPN